MTIKTEIVKRTQGVHEFSGLRLRIDEASAYKGEDSYEVSAWWTPDGGHSEKQLTGFYRKTNRLSYSQIAMLFVSAMHKVNEGACP